MAGHHTLRIGGHAIDIRDIASQGNAILGIRDSGKSYSATWLAEQFLAAEIPFVAFDPIGIWRWLRVPGQGKGARGWPVVVAGGQAGDLPLKPKAAAELVRAAMAEGISLVIDLYDLNLSKADWKRIVAECLRTLLYENGQHGLRHVFIEEAAEFAPQRIGPDQGQVYAEMEKLARMGGNALLGYTLINQRAEEVNKAVLELCDNLFLHRQKGRNSLTALGKWLDVADAGNKAEIIASLPTLPQGECWFWAAGTERPTHVKMPKKLSHHPDRRSMKTTEATVRAAAVDVSGFVGRMGETLKTITDEAEANDPKRLQARIRELEKQLDAARPGHSDEELDTRFADGYADGCRDGRIEGIRHCAERVTAHLQQFIGHLHDGLLTGNPYESPEPVVLKTERLTQTEIRRPVSSIKPKAATMPAPKAAARTASRPATGISRPQQRILDALAWLESVGITRADRVRAAMLADQSHRSSGYEKNVSTLKTAGLINYPDQGYLALTDNGRAAAQAPATPPTTRDLHDAIRSKVSGPQWNILQALIDAYPDSMTRETAAEIADQSPKSSGFEKNVSTLRSLGFIDYPERGFVVALPVLFLER